MSAHKIKGLTAQKTVVTKRSTQNTTKSQDKPIAPIILPNIKLLTIESKITKPIQKRYAQITISSLAQKTLNKLWTEVMGKYQKHKTILPNIPKLELIKRRIIF